MKLPLTLLILSAVNGSSAFIPLQNYRHNVFPGKSNNLRVPSFQSGRDNDYVNSLMPSLNAATSSTVYDKTSLKQTPPDGAIILSEDPMVYLIPDVLSPEECQSYIDRVQTLSSSGAREMSRSNPPDVSLNIEKLWPLPFLSLGAGIPPLIRILQGEPNDPVATILPPILIALVISGILAFSVVPLIRQFSDSSSRTSDAMALNLDEDILFVKDLVDRISEATYHPWHAWEAPVVTRYEPGAIFARHGDASPTKGSEWSQTGGQRVVTAICYLNNVQEGGGETSFDRLGISVKPKQGSALVFFPADVNTLEADDRTTHESLPPLEEKWIVQMFGRIGPRVPTPLGIPDSFNSDS